MTHNLIGDQNKEGGLMTSQTSLLLVLNLLYDFDTYLVSRDQIAITTSAINLMILIRFLDKLFLKLHCGLQDI